jgi:hypothetical protein
VDELQVASELRSDVEHRAARRLRSWFGIVLLVALSPTLTLSPLPSQDGSSHIYAARAIDGVLAGETPFAAVYDVDLSPNTNWLGGIVLYGLSRLVSPELAERLLIVLFVTIFSFGWWRLARGPSGIVRSPIVLFGPFFATGMTLHLGFYSYGVGFALLPWVWSLASGPARSLALAGTLAAVAWFGHVLPAAFACLGLVVIGSFAQTDSLRRRRIIEVVLSALPSAVLSIYWLFTRPPATVPSTHLDAMTLLEAVVTLRPLSAWVGATEHVAMVMALIFGAFVVGGHLAARRPGPSPLLPRARLWPWWALSGGTLAAYLTLPEGGQGFWFVSERLGLYPWLALVPVAANLNPRFVFPNSGLGKALTATIVTTCVLFGLLCWLAAKGIEEGQARSVGKMRSYIEKGTTAILLDFSRPETSRFRPYLHLLGRVAAEIGVVDASSHEPHTDHFQLRLRPHTGFPSPERLLGDPASLTHNDLRNVCTLVSIDAEAAWVSRIEADGWREQTSARDESSRTRIHHRDDAFCSRRARGE